MELKSIMRIIVNSEPMIYKESFPSDINREPKLKWIIEIENPEFIVERLCKPIERRPI